MRWQCNKEEVRSARRAVVYTAVSGKLNSLKPHLEFIKYARIQISERESYCLNKRRLVAIVYFGKIIALAMIFIVKTIKLNRKG